jgi:hypothetical protein
MTSEGAAPTSLRVAAGVIGLEALAAVGAGVGFLVLALTGKPADRATAVTLAVLLAVLGVGLALVTRGLLRCRPPAQTPAYLAQFFTLIVAYYQRHTLVAVTVALVLVAVLAVAALSAPDSRTALRRR